MSTLRVILDAEQAKREAREVADRITQIGAAGVKVSREIRDLQATLELLARGRLGLAKADLPGAVKTLSTGYRLGMRQPAVAGAAVSAVGDMVDAATQQAKSTTSTTNALKQATPVTQALAKVNKDLETSYYGVSAASQLTHKTILSLTGTLTSALAIRTATRTISEYDGALKQIQAVADLSADSLGNLDQRIREVSSSSQGFTPMETANALLEMAKAGFSADQALQALPSALDLAAAGAIDLFAATDRVVNIIQQFGLQATDAQRVSDVLVRTANRTTTDVQLLGESFKYAGDVAASAGLSIEELSAMFGVLAQSGIRGSMAGTSARSILLALLAPTREAIGQLEAMDVEIRKVNPAATSLVDIFNNLAKANLTAAEGANIFVKTALGGALAVTNAKDNLRSLLGELENVDGESRRVGSIIGDSLPYAFKRLKSAVYEAFLSAGDQGFKGVLRDTVDLARQVIIDLSGTAHGFDQVGHTASVVADTIRGLTAAVLAYIAAGFAGTLVAEVVAAGSLNAALKALWVTMLANPVTLVAAAIGALVGAIAYYKDELITFGDKTVTVGDLIVATAEWARDAILYSLKSIAVAINYIVDTAKTLVTGAFQLIVANFQINGNILAQNWELLFNGMLDSVKTWANAAIALAITVARTVESIASRIGGLLTAAAGFNPRDPTTWASVGSAIANITPQAIASDIASNIITDFSTDYIGQMRSLGQGAAIAFKAGVTTGLGDNAFKDFYRYMTPQGASQDILQRAAGRRAAREAILNEMRNPGDTQFGGPGYTPRVIGTGANSVPPVDRGLVRARERLSDYLADLQREKELLNQSNTEREIRKELLRGEELIDEAQVANKAAVLASLRQELVLLHELRELDKVGYDAGRTFAQAWQDFALGASNAADAVKNLIKDVQRLIFEFTVTKPATEWLGGLFSNWARGAAGWFGGGGGGIRGTPLQGPLQALGGIWNMGHRVTAFERGGLVSGATLFGMANGGAGLMGEKGTEGIFPIGRDSQGRLGVYGLGGGSAPPMVFNFHFGAGSNMDDFRRSHGQIAAEMRMAADRAYNRVY